MTKAVVIFALIALFIGDELLLTGALVMVLLVLLLLWSERETMEAMMHYWRERYADERDTHRLSPLEPPYDWEVEGE